MENVAQEIFDRIDQVATLLREMGGAGYEALVQTQQIEGVMGIILLALSVCCVFLAISRANMAIHYDALIVKADELNEKNKYESLSTFNVVLMLVFAILFVAFLISGFVNYPVSAFAPDGYVVREILQMR